ncbi:unnamed protein product [Pleuronectes platessa]|uniref:Uncharacterized protein n=1 Tax=Pleuronectes platessa TaxID=8262 RepID=A0A9N7U3B9_PLEPL|nr:unnamed protein product [Pleuronectes platessa]
MQSRPPQAAASSSRLQPPPPASSSALLPPLHLIGHFHSVLGRKQEGGSSAGRRDSEGQMEGVGFKPLSLGRLPLTPAAVVGKDYRRVCCRRVGQEVEREFIGASGNICRLQLETCSDERSVAVTDPGAAKHRGNNQAGSLEASPLSSTPCETSRSGPEEMNNHGPQP